jgi:hypothetical protein
MSKYTVWVGGVEVNDYYLETKEEATDLAKVWLDEDYDDVQIEEIK